MPQTKVAFYQDADGRAPVVEWLRELMKENEKAWLHCRARIEMLAQFGHELRRPAVDYLRDGIYELRAKQGHVQYRILYFFNGRQAAILAHSLTKEDSVPVAVIERALKRKASFELNPRKHTYESEDRNKKDKRCNSDSGADGGRQREA